MKIEKLIEMLASELKLSAIPEKDKNGFYQVMINPHLSVVIHELDPGLFITSKILPVPKEGSKEALFIHLMKANLLRQGTGGGAIGIDEEEIFFTLSLTLPFEVDYKTFHESLEDFLNFIDYWKEEIPLLKTQFLK